MKVLNALGYGGQMMAIGLLVVFSGLVILIIMISIMSAIFKSINNKKAKKAAEAAAAAAVPAPAEPVVEEAAQDDAIIDPQLIAVITAAIAAFDQSGKNLVVRKVRRAPGWKGSARQEQIYRF